MHLPPRGCHECSVTTAATTSRRQQIKHWLDQRRHRLGHSLQRRLLVLFVLLALGTTAVFMAGTREAFSTGWRDMARPLLVDYVDKLAAEIGDPPDLARAQALAQRLPISVAINGPRLQWRSNAARGAAVARHGLDQPSGYDSAWGRLLSRQTSDGHEIRFGLDAWRGHDDRIRSVGWLTLAGLLTLTALAFFTVRHLLRPLDDIRRGAQRYEAGDFSQPIARRRRDELGDLADQVNAMASGLQRMLQSQRGLLLAISHELRSPLTRARLNAELIDESPQRSALLRDLGAMRDMISGLLEGERLAGGPAALHSVPTALNALVQDTLDAQFASQAVRWSPDAALPLLRIDPLRMQMLLRNLIENAGAHGAGEQPVEVATRLTPTGIELEVRDHGEGVSPEQLARLAQPFYRPDSARTRERGGVGLGLYLCRSVALSHGGELRIARAEPGLRVTLWLPLNLVVPV